MIKIFFLTIFLSIYLNASDMRALIFNGNCTTCHFINESISAPSIKIVKQNYERAFQNKKDFVQYMSKWVIKPNIENSIMLDAVEKYKLMPELGYEIETIKEIASYIYDTDF